MSMKTKLITTLLVVIMVGIAIREINNSSSEKQYASQLRSIQVTFLRLAQEQSTRREKVMRFNEEAVTPHLTDSQKTFINRHRENIVFNKVSFNYENDQILLTDDIIIYFRLDKKWFGVSAKGSIDSAEPKETD